VASANTFNHHRAMSAAFLRIVTCAFAGFSAGTAMAYACRPLFTWVSLTLQSKSYGLIESDLLTVNLVALGIIGFMLLGSALGGLWSTNLEMKNPGAAASRTLKKALLVSALFCLVAISFLLLSPPITWNR
jgi:hypothetical protein